MQFDGENDEKYDDNCDQKHLREISDDDFEMVSFVCAGFASVTLFAVQNPLEQTYWIVALFILFCTLFVAVRTYSEFFENYEFHHPLTAALLLIITPDIVMLLNYIPSHLASLSLDGTAWQGIHFCFNNPKKKND